MQGSLREWAEFAGDQYLLGSIRRTSPRDYNDFVDQLYDDLDLLMGELESDAKDFIEASEDVLNRELARLLRVCGYSASHDNDEGGHVDIHVKSRNQKYSWLGEAKLDNGPQYIGDGLVQLTTRYARGTPGHHCGGLLVYFQKARCAERFGEWRTKFEEDTSWEDRTISECTRRPGLSFYSEFVLNRMGKGVPKYRIRYMAISLFRKASEPAAPPL